MQRIVERNLRIQEINKYVILNRMHVIHFGIQNVFQNALQTYRTQNIHTVIHTSKHMVPYNI